ncbi:MAG: MerR family transcriptional regulator [Vicinamibacterales bacterium]
MSESEFDLKALSERARVTPRTVHFYVQQGLLPPASSPGPGARYGEGHVQRLALIRLLQKQHLPLAEIAKRLKGLSDRQVSALILETQARAPSPRGSALEYIREVLSNGPPPSDQSFAPRQSSAVSASPPAAYQSAAGSARSQWDRFLLTDGIEVHVRRPLARSQQRQLDRLLAAGRHIFEEEQP